MADDSPKIIIDEGWKAQVQREKEEAARKLAADVKPETQAETKPLEDEEAPLEPSSFLGLVQSIATQGLLMLGLIAAPESKQVMVDITGAKYIIDTLIMLRQKTQGNLSAEESAQLAEIIAELQHAYVVRAQQVQEHALRQAGVDPTNLKGGL
ncbi:MAG: hypothetical protein AMXMBFR84_41060 [Candidatus Hydrogenedentota bacterium]